MQHDVTYCAGARMENEILRQFLCLLEASFPPHERRVRSGQLALMDNPFYSIRTLQDNGKLLGFMALWHFSNMTFLEHFAVDASLRSGGIGGRMLDELRKDVECGGKLLVLEAELPVDELTKRRIAFYRRHGLSVNNFLYYQMPLRTGDAATQMHLLSSTPFDEKQFYAAQKEIYCHVYGLREV